MSRKVTELQEALEQINEIRLRLARSEVFTGYRALPAAISGLLAIAAGLAQPYLAPVPASDPLPYLVLWIGVAVLSALIGTVLLRLRPKPSDSGRLGRQTTWLAVEQFLPAMLAGGLLTMALARYAPETLWLLPGLWQILFALGLFAACRMLPRGMAGVAVWFLVTGFLCFRFAAGEHAFTPWAMAVPFGVGQLMAAGVLYWSLERWDGRPA